MPLCRQAVNTASDPNKPVVDIALQNAGGGRDAACGAQFGKGYRAGLGEHTHKAQRVLAVCGHEWTTSRSSDIRVAAAAVELGQKPVRAVSRHPRPIWRRLLDNRDALA